MTLVRPCVRPSVLPSVLPSVRPKSCPRNSSYVFHRIDLKFYRLYSYDMKMCMWFSIFVSAIFDGVTALADSDLPKSCPRNSSYIFHRIDLKFYRLYSYDMKMCMWFFIFVSAIFNGVTALADLDLVPATPATSCIRLTWNCAECFIMIWRCACDFGISIVLFFTKLWPFVVFWHFSNFWTVWPRELKFGMLLAFGKLIILIIVRMC